MGIAAMAIPVIVTGAILMAGKTADFSQLTERLNYDFNVKVFKLNLSGLTITLDFWLDNPTSQNLSISYPFVMIYYDQTFVCQNSVIDQSYKLKAKNQLVIPNITFKVSLFKIANILSIDKTTLINAISTLSFKPYLDILQKKFTSTSTFEINKLPITYKDTLFGTGHELSAISREIKACPQYDYLFPVPRGSKKMVIKDGSVHDTVKMMHKIVNQDYKLVSKAANELFKAPTIYKTSQKIFDFIFKYIKYNLEEGEQLRNPAVTYHLGQRLARDFYKKNGYFSREYSADCDDIAIFTASILKNLGIKYAFRIASYSAGTNYSHVYVIVFDENGKQIIIDPVYYKFNSEKHFFKQKTYDNKMNTLNGIPVYYLSGLGETNQNTIDNVYDFLLYSSNVLKNAHGYRQSVPVLEQMFEYLIKYWNTPNRNKALQIIVEKEKNLKDIIYRNCPFEKMFFEELQGFNNNGFGKFGEKFKDFVKRQLDKLKNVAQKTQATNKIISPVSPTSSPLPPVNSYNRDSAKKTFRDIISKYKIPIAIGTFVTTTGIVIAVSPKMQHKLGLKK